ncbi:MAG: amidohydrolase family protein, partial [Deltaproteobacteria bacterium]|nr:amidohydrolase family protein [Deltaproteobacteria bacterium]
MKTVLRGGNVIDGTGREIQPNMTVAIEGSKIVDVGDQSEFGSDWNVLDVSGKTVLPGLIDCHNHFAPKLQWLISEQANSLMYLASETVHAMKGCLEAGCTTTRDMGGLEAGFVRAQAEGLIWGPRLQTALVIIGPTNGLIDSIPPLGGAISPQGMHATAPGMPSPWCNSPWEARAKVREVLRYGADVIKVANTDIGNTRALFTQEELDAI